MIKVGLKPQKVGSVWSSGFLRGLVSSFIQPTSTKHVVWARHCA